MRLKRERLSGLKRRMQTFKVKKCLNGVNAINWTEDAPVPQ